MNIFNKVALQGMKNNRTRTIVTIIGVILSSAMIAAVATFGVSLLDFMIKGSIAKYGNWHVAFLNVDSSFVEERIRDEEAANAAAIENIGYAMLDGAKTPEKPYLFISGFGQEAFETLPISLISGRLPENSGEVLVPSHVAAKGGVRYKVGDTLKLAVGDRRSGTETLTQHAPYLSGNEPGTEREILEVTAQKSYTVVGTCERPGFEEHSAPGYTLITKADMADQTCSRSVFVTLKEPGRVQTYASGTAGAGEYIFNDNLLRFMGLSEDKLFNAILYSVGGILLAIIMIGSIFLIYNSFNISLNERTHQFGILSSAGATAKQLRSSVLFEGFCIGAIGIPIGIAAGIGSIGLLIPVVSSNFGNILTADVPLTLSVSVPAISAAAVFSLITILISAYIPARKAASIPVMECIRQTNEIKTESKAMKTSGLAQHICGLEGTLALKNFKRNKKRYRSIVLSLVLSVVLFVVGSSFGKTLKLLAERYTVDMDYDILFTTGGITDSERLSLYEKLKNASGVYESISETVYGYLCAVHISDLSDRYREYAGYTGSDETVELPMYLQFIDDSEYLRFIREMGLPEEEYTGTEKMPVFARKKVANPEGAPSEVFDVFSDDSVTLGVYPEAEGQKGPDSIIHTTIVDKYPVDLPPIPHDREDSLFIIMIAPYSLKGSFETQDANAYISLGFLSDAPLQTVGELETIIQKEGVTSDYTLYSVYAVLDQFRSATFVVDLFTCIFVIMISLIAVANVFNTISTNIKLRRRELAMLRSMGMDDRGFNRMMNFECVFYGMRTLLFGIPIAGLLSWLIYRIIASAEQLNNFKFPFPWASMTLSVLSVFLIVFLTMLYATNKIKKENIIDALRDEIT